MRNFGLTTDQLIVLADWLQKFGVDVTAVDGVNTHFGSTFHAMIKTRTAFDPGKLGHPTLVRQRKERSRRKLAAPPGFSHQPTDAGAAA